MKFIKNVIAEMKAVTWPKFSGLVRTTGLVVLSIALLAIFFGTIDTGIGALIRSLLSL
ncbi:preprotein translocase subunit SecE [Carnobacteriaceae bacterium zg-ZUI252]|nr:preprotein translocase subunit SecE [Carnobacteriaceae bacterium zg-ZUI252]QTU82444.1 preprotein translocase subunit SecE [Carnobacteriaceae bacterium zg-C25]